MNHAMTHLALSLSVFMASAACATGPIYTCDFDWATTGNGGCESGEWGRFTGADATVFAALQPEGSPYGCSIFCYPSYCFAPPAGCIELASNCYAVTSSSGGIQVFPSAACRRFGGKFYAPPSATAPEGELLFVFKASISGPVVATHTASCFPGAPTFVDVDIEVPAGFGYLQVIGNNWLCDDLFLEAQQPPPPCVADLFVDEQVDGADLGILLNQWGLGKGAVADINRDGAVDGADLSILLNSWGACP
ncbi:MAG: Dockerin type domain [Pseudomonadota bacterium]|jgi:hypothetical protein